MNERIFQHYFKLVPPKNRGEEMNTTAVLMDFAIASVFILIGQLIRSKVKLVQRYFVPASMIAGFLALALGSQGLNVLPFSKAIGSYSGLLIIIVFASVLESC